MDCDPGAAAPSLFKEYQTTVSNLLTLAPKTHRQDGCSRQASCSSIGQVRWVANRANSRYGDNVLLDCVIVETTCIRRWMTEAVRLAG